MLYLDSAGEVRTKLSWTAPTENTDGTPIDYELSYNLYVDGAQHASFPGSLNPDGKYETEIDPLGLPAGQSELTLTAFDVAYPGRESDQSNPIVLTGLAGPLAPAAFSSV